MKSNRPTITTEELRNELLVTMDSLHRRRADLVSEDLIAGYVALNWLEWNGGTLQLTVTGKNVCQQMRVARGMIEPDAEGIRATTDTP